MVVMIRNAGRTGGGARIDRAMIVVEGTYAVLATRSAELLEFGGEGRVCLFQLRRRDLQSRQWRLVSELRCACWNLERIFRSGVAGGARSIAARKRLQIICTQATDVHD